MCKNKKKPSLTEKTVFRAKAEKICSSMSHLLLTSAKYDYSWKAGIFIMYSILTLPVNVSYFEK